ncbi:VOC family protein [Paenibacillus tianjinensis]|uniref:VOC family protein n=1 Tax=Paenibacillus tianjinensis TaxID=2810347 RepID=UPI0038CD4D69
MKVPEFEAEHSRIAALKFPGLTEISTLLNGSRYFFFDGPDGEKLEFFESTRSN